MSGSVVELQQWARRRRLNGLLVIQDLAKQGAWTAIGLYVDGDVVPMAGRQFTAEPSAGGDQCETIDLFCDSNYRVSVVRTSLELTA